jgi:hypothetical protein
MAYRFKIRSVVPTEFRLTDASIFNILAEAGGGGDYPDPANVLEADTTNGSAGIYHAPSVAEVISTAVFGALSAETGTYHVATVAEVLDTVSFGAASALTGTVHLPLVGEVISTASFGPASGLTGTYHVAAVGEVLLGVGFGALSAETGTLAVDTGNLYQARATQAVAIQTRGVHKG